MKRERERDEAIRPKRRFVVVCYDIPKDRRRNRVCKLLKNYGERAQYSVFECLLRPKELRQLKQRLKSLIVPQEDDVRFYRLCENCLRKTTIWSTKERRHWDEAIVV
jgi:CRISPR-associated protein Cas2